MEQLLNLDYAAFDAINHGWAHPWLDVIMPILREKTTWLPLYLLWVVLLAWRYRLQALYFLLALGLTAGCGDFISSEIIKKNVERPRPCREERLDEPARLLVGCGGGYSFTSSHATNHFAVAVFVFLTWGRLWGRWRWLLPVWAASIALGQVYVGVHYPLDVTAGALLGTGLGLLGSWAYRCLHRLRINAFYA